MDYGGGNSIQARTDGSSFHNSLENEIQRGLSHQKGIVAWIQYQQLIFQAVFSPHLNSLFGCIGRCIAKNATRDKST